MHFYLKLANNNHIGILDVLLTDTKLVTTENPGLLSCRVWDRPKLAPRHREGRCSVIQVPRLGISHLEFYSDILIAKLACSRVFKTVMGANIVHKMTSSTYVYHLLVKNLKTQTESMHHNLTTIGDV